MSAVENPVPAKKPRRPRRQPWPVMVAKAAKLGFITRAVEQQADGTVRLLFAEGSAPTQAGRDDAA